MSEVGQTIKQFIDYIYKDDTTSCLGTALYMGKLLATTEDFPVWLFKAVLSEMLLIFIIYLKLYSSNPTQYAFFNILPDMNIVKKLFN